MCSGGDVKTIRHNDCALLVEKTGARCAQCMEFRSSLRATVAAQAKQSSQSKTSPSSRAPLAHLTHRELVERCKLSKKREYSLVAKNKQLASKIEKLLESSIVEVSSEVSKACGDAIAKQQKSGDTESLSSIFIAQQLKAQSVHKNGMRWHPLIIRWALGLKIKSTAAYRYIARSGAVVLPSESTLADYAHYRPINSGIDVDALLELCHKHQAGLDVALIANEIKIKDGIANKNGQISGYIALDDLDQALEELLNSNQATAVATHALAYMMQGITQHINYPLTIYGTKSATSSQMYNTFWERVEACELAGFKVRPFICDGASANGKMFKLHASDYPADEIVHRCMNKFADRPIYFVSDVPHRVKHNSELCGELGQSSQVSLSHDKFIFL